jgi:hypothetical protein
MTLSDDCPCGRSQLFTFKTKEIITVDRPTFERILTLLIGCSNHLEYLVTHEIFVGAPRDYLATFDNLESRKALALVSVWTDTSTETFEELADCLDEALQSIKFILAASAGGGND